MTTRNPHCSVNQSVSPVENMHSVPIYGTATGTQEQTIGSGAEDAGEPNGAPGEEIETEVEKETMEDEE